jgi:REP element-mobilizing transposase RayT
MTALAIGGVPDHVHMLLMIPAALSLAKAMQLIKGLSSGWVHETFPSQQSFAWQDGYGAFSVSLSLVPKVAAYIRDQPEHHRTQTFEQEFVAFLQRHGIGYDPEYVLG